MFVTFEEFKSPNTVRISLRRMGFMLLEPDGYLSMIYVRPDKRRHGYGDKMISYANRLFPNIYAIAGSAAGESLLRKNAIPSPL
jgi:ribosomal protein S18 acetylase RimI-like enzyme